jgi:hypothetical protein
MQDIEKMSLKKAKPKVTAPEDEFLDSILEQALDDFEVADMQKKVNETQNLQQDSSAANHVDREAENLAKLEDLLVNMEDPRFGSVLASTMKDLSGTQEGAQTVEATFKNMAKQYENEHSLSYLPKDDEDEAGIMSADRQVAAAMQMMGQAQKGMHGLDVNKMEEAGESMMEEMMAQFEALGEKEDYNVSIYIYMYFLYYF